MQVKVQCPCGARFEFPVEPVQGRMPVSINCPVCGADATALANEVILRQTPAPAAPPPGLRISRPAPEPAPVPAPEAAAAEPAAAKPAAQPRYVPRPVPQRNPEAGKHKRLVKYAAWSGTALVVALISFWGWYKFGRHPQVVYSAAIPKTGSDESFQLLAPGRLLSVKDRQATLRDLAAERTLWTAMLPDDAEPGPSTFFDSLLSPPQAVLTASDLWLPFRNQLLRLDPQTGKFRDTAVPGRILDVAADADAILVLSAAMDGRQSITRVSLPDAKIETEEIAMPVRAAAAPRTPARPASAPADAQPASAPMDRVRTALLPAGSPGNPVATTISRRSQPFVPAGTSAAEFQTALLERKTVTREAMKPKGKSILDSDSVTASQGLDMAQEMLNDSQRARTGGVETEDVSRYQVTVHRQFAKDVADWTGEVTGPPEFIPLRTVDVVAGGRAIQVLDRENRKIWDATLTFPLPSPAVLQDGRMPCIETRDGLYLADKGILTAFNPASGTVRWRLNSVGITAVQADAHGKLYVDTAGADPEALKYSQQVNVRDKGHRFILKVDPLTGKVLWRSELAATAYHAILSGDYVYARRDWSTQDPLRFEEGPDRRFTLSLLNPANGELIWTQLRVNHPVYQIEIRQDWMLLRYDDKMQVLKFFHF